MRRGGLGAAGVLKQRERAHKMTALGEKLDEDRSEKAREMLTSFRTKITEFALKYRSRIQKDPVFREQFVCMCESLGVDPIQISKSGTSNWWSDVVGMGTFYTDLAVQILTQCMISRKSTYGSLLPVKRCMELIQTDNVSIDDLRRAIASLDCLGAGGVRIVNIGGELFVSSLPDEIGSDPSAVATSFDSPNGQTLTAIATTLGWPAGRAKHAIDGLLKEGVLWTDDHQGVTTYWVISLWLK